MTDIVLASRNAKKLKEMQALLAPLGYRARLVSEFTDEAAEETAPSFIENALLKARHAARVSGLPALADDSGLEVDALKGAPGVYSARYGEAAWLASTAREAAERPAMDGRAVIGAENPGCARDGWTQAEKDVANNAKLLQALAGVPAARRGARFVSALALLRHAEDPTPVIALGYWPGVILEAPRGASGFGYDPLFLVPSLGKTSAELAPALKNRISHRGRAMRALLKQLRADSGFVHG
ncbi:MAG: RdgB/HAM1 family non-canonical purine NTP pyrophosphatase [Stagnimonas sp.]|nr:RdgB/HAM1 family non-canonical purine NTP pyrophosphatase [Stagnimonas sp.]